jgi:hypothetical protein
MRRLGYPFIFMAALALTAATGFAKDGKLKIKVVPKHAYVFVDEKAIREGSEDIRLAPGKHAVAVVNYGYKAFTQDVTIESDKTVDLKVTLEAYGGPVSSPFGQIEFRKGDRHSAVLLNGTTSSYFAGNVGAANHGWWWHRSLLVPPGPYQITVTRRGSDVWSGDVSIVANQKVSIDLARSGAQTAKVKEDLTNLTNVPRYKGGWMSDLIAVAGVTGTFNVAPASINCGQSSTLNWQTSETVGPNGAVPANGSQTVTPRTTTFYVFNVAGPGGIFQGAGGVNVNTRLDASLSANPTELHYQEIGDKVITQESSTLTWSTTNADSISIDPVGVVDPSGTQTVTGEPRKTDIGPVDESTTYTLRATNVCGGAATRTVTIHISGSVEPVPERAKP